MIGVEAAGKGLDTEFHAASICKGALGIIHGFKCYTLENDTYSIAAGLDYPGVGPEHSYYSDIKRAKYISVTDKEALDGFLILSKMEGIIPALESSHAIAYAIKLAKTLDKDKIIIVNLSGRGDKDVAQVKQFTRND